MSNMNQEQIGVVAIGRNEGERLQKCLKSCSELGQVVYVDSGSTDDSVPFARSINAEVVELDTSIGFTAARARNAGFRRLLELVPDVKFVQFLDGDCELVDGWISAALAYMSVHENCAAVCGRRRETEAGKNIYHRLTDMEWDTPAGPAKYCGGDVLMRVDALRAAEGYRDTLIAGEEPELCVRLRQQGWSIYRLDQEMTRHDIRMDSWKQWWKRAVRAGHAFAEGAKLHGQPPERHWVKERRSILIWGILFPLLAALLAWPTWGASLGVLALAYLAITAKTTLALRRHANLSWRDATLYGIHCIAAKLPQAYGLLLYHARLLTGRMPKLVEYRGPATASSQRRDMASVNSP